MKKAVLWALSFTLAGLLGFAFLIWAALYLSDDWMLRQGGESALAQWMPAQDELPADMMLIYQDSADNGEVAEQYANPAQVHTMLDRWGRQEGYTRYYVSRDRCLQQGVRSVSMGWVRVKESEGAQEYFHWLWEKDGAANELFSIPDLGEENYLFWQMDSSQCTPGEQEKILEVDFRRANLLGRIVIRAAAGQNPDEALFEMALELARRMEARLP